MGKFALILVLGGIITFGIINISMNGVSNRTTDNAINKYEENQSRNIANSTVQMLISKIGDDSAFRSTNPTAISMFGGNAIYTVKDTSIKANNYFTNDINAIKISVTANYIGVEKTINTIITQKTSSSGPPAFFNYALLSGESITMNGNVNITDDNNPQWNANVHTNKDFHMNGNNNISGFLTYGGTASSNPSWGMDSHINPNQNPNNDPDYSQSKPVDIPEFSPEDYISKATTVYNSNKTLSGNIYLGTKDKPKIIYVGGDLNLKGTVTGYGSLIVKGNINISGNVNVSSPDPNYSNLGLYSGGNINASGNLKIHAQIFANDNINLSGNSKIYGSMTSRGVNNFSGNVNLYYHPANSSLTQPFWPGSQANNPDVSSSGSHRMDVLNWYE